MELPWLLQRENIAKIEGNKLLIGDRRRYPFEKAFVTCSTINEIVEALKTMVTQGGGPLQVALTTLRLYANSPCKELKRIASLLASARPTNTTMARTLDKLLKRVDAGEPLIPLLDALEAAYDEDYRQMGRYGAALIKDSSVILTTCFAEHSFIYSLLLAREAGKEVHVLVAETRPYLQGSRLTAPSLCEVNIPCEIISDAMGAHYMANGEVNHYMTACDAVAMDGTVANKVGTLANAIAATYYSIPYTVLALSPDNSLITGESIVLEERDGKEILQIRGVYTTQQNLKGRYPSFDKIEPSLITNIVTPQGIFAPNQISEAYL
ncbi:MAG: translation initiation factor 2 [Sphaerochaetaceae bacterium]